LKLLILSCFALLTLSLAGCGGDSPSAMNAEFRTLSGCIEGIKKNSGQSLKIITDTPSEVSGFLSNGQGFGCQKKTTGTKGTYYAGWFMVK